MAELLIIFLISFSFSFLGSIPPGAINLSIIQLSLQGNKPAAYRFALAAALIEYPYAYIALRFEAFITSSPFVQSNFTYLAAAVMITLGIIGLVQNKSSDEKWKKYKHSGFRKGVIISILNPLAIPFWIGVTAYLKSIGWVELNREVDYHIYVSGVSIGTFTLLYLLAYFADLTGRKLKDSPYIAKIPAYVFLILGLYSLVKIFLN